MATNHREHDGKGFFLPFPSPPVSRLHDRDPPPSASLMMRSFFFLFFSSRAELSDFPFPTRLVEARASSSPSSPAYSSTRRAAEIPVLFSFGNRWLRDTAALFLFFLSPIVGTQRQCEQRPPTSSLLFSREPRKRTSLIRSPSFSFFLSAHGWSGHGE